MVGKSGNLMLLVCVLISQLCLVDMQTYCADSLDPFPNPQSCETFYECDYYDGKITRYQIHCDDRTCCGNHFSKETLTCVHPDKALCSPELRNLTCNEFGERLAHPTNCSRYFECNAALRPTVIDCPTDFHFSSQLEMCVPKEEARCDCHEFDNPMRPLLLPDPTSCAAFYKCHNGQRVPMLCPHNLYFSVVKDRCEFPITVACKNGVRSKS